MRYRGSDKALPEIAREIGVDHIMEGSVLRAGERVRVSLQLIRAEPEQHLWAERYERDIGDVLAVQSDVARAVASEILDKLTMADEEPLQSARPVAPQVLEAYLKGRYHLNKRTQESVERAVICFQEAIDLDQLHAPSHAGMSSALAVVGQRTPSPMVAERARAAARRALEIDPALADAHASLGLVSYFYDWNWAAAERARTRVPLGPSVPVASS
jgi:hypothetical protein